MAAYLRADAAPGTELLSIARQFSPDDFRRGTEQTIHTDAEAARREGLAAPVATGPQVASLIFRQLRACFGRGWIDGGTCSLTFRRPVRLDDFCIAKGVVTQRETLAGGVRLHCDVWIENARGERVIVGVATGTVTAS